MQPERRDLMKLALRALKRAAWRWQLYQVELVKEPHSAGIERSRYFKAERVADKRVAAALKAGIDVMANLKLARRMDKMVSESYRERAERYRLKAEAAEAEWMHVRGRQSGW